MTSFRIVGGGEVLDMDAERLWTDWLCKQSPPVNGFAFDMRGLDEAIALLAAPTHLLVSHDVIEWEMRRVRRARRRHRRARYRRGRERIRPRHRSQR